VNKLALLLAMGFAFAAPQTYDGSRRDEPPPNPELLRQEVINLELEGARAILLGNGTFFRRAYSDDFTGVLSSGEAVNKSLLIEKVQTPSLKYESFNASDIKVRIYRDTAVASCLWSVRAISNGKRISSQMRVTHVYVYSNAGYRVVASQTTLLPASAEQPL
jgi:hypothetical protein